MQLLQNKLTKLTKLLVLILLNLWGQVTLALALEENPVYTWCDPEDHYNNPEFLHSKETCIAKQCAASFNLETKFSMPPVIGIPANWDAYGYQDVDDCINSAFLPNFYEILDLPNSRPTQAQIKKNYRKAALKLHPDKTIHMSDINRAITADMFKRVSNAYAKLQDPRNYNLYQTAVAKQGLAHWAPDFLERFIAARNTAASAAGASEAKGVGAAGAAANNIGGYGDGYDLPIPAGDLALLYPELMIIYRDINRQLEIFNQTTIKLLSGADPDATMALFRKNLEESEVPLYLLSIDTKNLLAQNSLNFQWTSADLANFRLISEAAGQISANILDLYNMIYKIIAGEFIETQNLRAQLEITIAKYEANPHIGDLASKLNNLRTTVQLVRQKYIQDLTANLATAEKLNRNINRACQDYLTILKPASIAIAVPVGIFAELAQNLVHIVDLVQRNFITGLDAELNSLFRRIDRILVTDPKASRIDMLQREIADLITSSNWATAESRLLELERLLDQALNSGSLTQAQINEINQLMEFIEHTRSRINRAGGARATAVRAAETRATGGGGGGGASVPTPISVPVTTPASATDTGAASGGLTYGQASSLKNLPKNRANLEKIIAAVKRANEPRDMLAIKLLARYHGVTVATKADLLAKLQAELALL